MLDSIGFLFLLVLATMHGVKASYGPSSCELANAILDLFEVCDPSGSNAVIGSIQNPARSCKHLKNVDKYAPSGEYWIKPKGLNKMQVYCEMDIQGGGFTFISTRHVTDNATSSSISQLFTDRSAVLFRIVANDFTQYYSVVRQLDSFASRRLTVQQNTFTQFTGPVNRNTIGRSGFIYLGILNRFIARAKGATQGYKSNGKDVTFVNCDANPNSYIVLYPNHDKLKPSSYFGGDGVFRRWRNTFIRVQAGLEMPHKYFYFTEMHFGGCGAYVSSDRWGTLTGSAIGVR
jgi:hypothetical protein